MGRCESCRGLLHDARQAGVSDVHVILRAIRHQDPGVRKWAVGRREVLAAAARGGQLSAEHVAGSPPGRALRLRRRWDEGVAECLLDALQSSATPPLDP